MNRFQEDNNIFFCREIAMGVAMGHHTIIRHHHTPHTRRVAPRTRRVAPHTRRVVSCMIQSVEGN